MALRRGAIRYVGCTRTLHLVATSKEYESLTANAMLVFVLSTNEALGYNMRFRRLTCIGVRAGGQLSVGGASPGERSPLHTMAGIGDHYCPLLQAMNVVPW